MVFRGAAKRGGLVEKMFSYTFSIVLADLSKDWKYVLGDSGYATLKKGVAGQRISPIGTTATFKHGSLPLASTE